MSVYGSLPSLTHTVKLRVFSKIVKPMNTVKAESIHCAL